MGALRINSQILVIFLCPTLTLDKVQYVRPIVVLLCFGCPLIPNRKTLQKHRQPPQGEERGTIIIICHYIMIFWWFSEGICATQNVRYRAPQEFCGDHSVVVMVLMPCFQISAKRKQYSHSPNSNPSPRVYSLFEIVKKDVLLVFAPAAADGTSVFREFLARIGIFPIVHPNNCILDLDSEFRNSVSICKATKTIKRTSLSFHVLR